MALPIAKGLGSAPDPEAAQHWWQVAAQAGNADAQWQLGERLIQDGQPALARPWIEKAAAQGSVEAKQRLADLYQHQLAPASDVETRGALGTLAASLHSPTLETASAVSGLIGASSTEQQSIGSLQPRAEQGDPVAQYQLGLHYLSGDWDVPKDQDQAFAWLARAADAGNRLASLTLAELRRHTEPGASSGVGPRREASEPATLAPEASMPDRIVEGGALADLTTWVTVSASRVDSVAVFISLILVVGYHQYLRYRLLHDPSYTIQSINSQARAAWVRHIMGHPGQEVLAVQTLRNSTMAATFLASTAILLIMGVLNLLHETGSGDRLLSPLHGDAPLIGLGHLKLLALLVDFFWSFFCFSQAVRMYNHVGYLINTGSSGGGIVSPDYVARLLNRSGSYYSLGMRSYYISVPLVFWLFGPYLLLASSIGLVMVLYHIDRSPAVGRSEIADESAVGVAENESPVANAFSGALTVAAARTSMRRIASPPGGWR